MANLTKPQQTPVQIQILAPTGTTQVVQFKAHTLTVGRSSDNQLVLDDKQVSNHHLRIEVLADQISVTDLGSRNGTHLANEPLPPNQPKAWTGHQVLQVGQHRLTLVLAPSLPGPTSFWNWQEWSGQGKRYVNLLLTPVLPTWPTWLLTIFNQPRLRPWRPLLLSGGALLILFAGWWTLYNNPESARQPSGVTLLPTFTSTPVAIIALSANAPSLATPTMPVITPLSATPNSTNVSALGVSTLVPIYTPLPTTPLPTSPMSSNRLIEAAQVLPENRRWDSRLDQLGVTLEEAAVLPGQPYWRLIEAQWQDEQEAAGKHHIYVNVLDQNGQPMVGQSVTISWPDGSTSGLTESKAAPDYGFNFQMFAPGYSYTARVDDLPSDSVHNLGMGNISHREMKIHTTFLLTFQKTVK